VKLGLDLREEYDLFANKPLKRIFRAKIQEIEVRGGDGICCTHGRDLNIHTKCLVDKSEVEVTRGRL
jgi:hypothetical protein